MRRINWMAPVLLGLLLAGCASAGSQTTTSLEDLEAPPTTESAAAPSSSSGSTAPSSTTTSEAILDPRVEDAMGLASTFMNGFADRDMETIEATAVEVHVFGFIVDAFDRFPNEFAWLDAVGWAMTVNDCVVTNPDLDNTRLSCQVSHENAWSRALGVGPYDGELFLGVTLPGTDSWVYGDRDQPVVTERALAQFPTFFFTNEAWNPFIEWVDANHPDDLSIMLTPLEPSELQFLPANPSLTEESIELWRAHTEDFVAEAGPDS